MKRNNYGFFNQDEYELHVGRMATRSGIIGLLIGLIISIISNFSLFGTSFTIIIFFYLFLTGFWGIYKLNFWFRKYRYKLPLAIWHILRIIIIISGFFLGILGYGIFEHFLLLIAISMQNKSLIAAQIIITPYIGQRYARRVNYDPSQYR